MTNKEAANLIDIIRMGYICDPQECGLEEVKGICNMLKCDDFHEACVMAIEALEKMEPMEATERFCGDGWNDYFKGECPRCGKTIEAVKRCPHCDQAIRWVEE